MSMCAANALRAKITGQGNSRRPGVKSQMTCQFHDRFVPRPGEEFWEAGSGGFNCRGMEGVWQSGTAKLGLGDSGPSPGRSVPAACCNAVNDGLRRTLYSRSDARGVDTVVTLNGLAVTPSLETSQWNASTYSHFFTSGHL